MMNKFLTLFIVFWTGYVYSQQTIFTENNVKSEISDCKHWNQDKSECLQHVICQLQPQSTDEPESVVCSCHTEESSYYSFHNLSSTLNHSDGNEEVRKVCMSEFDLDYNQITHVSCHTRYTYLCSDGLITHKPW